MPVPWQRRWQGLTPGRAGRLVKRMPDDKRKAEAFASLGMMHEAAIVAAQVKDGDLLGKFQGMVGSAGTPLHSAINQLKEKLAAGRS